VGKGTGNKSYKKAEVKGANWKLLIQKVAKGKKYRENQYKRA
jgi:hypothetical protein